MSFVQPMMLAIFSWKSGLCYLYRDLCNFQMTFVYICVCLFPLVLHMASTEYMFAVERDKWMAAFGKQTFPNIWPQNWGNCWWSDRLWTWSTFIQPEGSHLETSPREDQKVHKQSRKKKWTYWYVSEMRNNVHFLPAHIQKGPWTSLQTPPCAQWRAWVRGSALNRHNK